MVWYVDDVYQMRAQNLFLSVKNRFLFNKTYQILKYVPIPAVWTLNAVHISLSCRNVHRRTNMCWYLWCETVSKLEYLPFLCIYHIEAMSRYVQTFSNGARCILVWFFGLDCVFLALKSNSTAQIHRKLLNYCILVQVCMTSVSLWSVSPYSTMITLTIFFAKDCKLYTGTHFRLIKEVLGTSCKSLLFTVNWKFCTCNALRRIWFKTDFIVVRTTKNENKNPLQAFPLHVLIQICHKFQIWRLKQLFEYLKRCFNASSFYILRFNKSREML